MVYVHAGARAAGTLPVPGCEGRVQFRATARQERGVDTAVFDVVRDRAAFDALESDWNDLFDRAGKGAQLFQTFNWNWHWANHYLPAGGVGGPSLAIVTVRRQGRLVMLWPLVTNRIAGLSVLRWLGEPVSQYGDVLVEDRADAPELMRQAWDFIAAKLGADALHLRKVRADAAVAPLLRELGLRPAAAAEAPFLDLASAPDFRTYEMRYTSKARKNRRRLARRLAEQGPSAFKRHTGGPEARAAALEAVALKRAWVEKSGRVSAALGDDRFAAFFADVADGCGRPAGCGITVLEVDGTAAGAAIDISCHGHRAAHVIVHDPRLDRFSAGTLLLEAWIKGASADGVATFDLLAPAYAYKSDWADGAVVVADFAVGLSLAGRAYAVVYLGRVRQALKAGVEAAPRAVAAARALASAFGLRAPGATGADAASTS